MKFSTYLAAHIRAMTLREFGERLHAYRCEHCGKWHMGHSSKGPRKWRYGR